MLALPPSRTELLLPLSSASLGQSRSEGRRGARPVAPPMIFGSLIRAFAHVCFLPPCSPTPPLSTMKAVALLALLPLAGAFVAPMTKVSKDPPPLPPYVAHDHQTPVGAPQICFAMGRAADFRLPVLLYRAVVCGRPLAAAAPSRCRSRTSPVSRPPSASGWVVGRLRPQRERREEERMRKVAVGRWYLEGIWI